VSLFGTDVTVMQGAERARLVSVIPQEVETPMAFTVQEIVMIGRTTAISRWQRPTPKDWNIVERAMVYTDIIDMRYRLLTELSGGEKQRVIVAMALAQEPRAILMDEATSHLDINHRLEIMQIVERLNKEQGVTVIMISHDLNLAAEFCETLFIMDHGRVVSRGTPEQVLKENVLKKVYHCDVRVQQNPTSGSITVTPAPRLAPGLSGQGVKIHVIAGGGSGEEVLRRLSLCNYSVTCGVLNHGDSDADVTAALDIKSALEKPFSPVSRPVLDSALDMVKETDIVIVCGVPFGPGNTANLELANRALADGKRILLRAGIENRDYSPGKAAVTEFEKLTAGGAQYWHNITDLIGLLS